MLELTAIDDDFQVIVRHFQLGLEFKALCYIPEGNYSGAKLVDKVNRFQFILLADSIVILRVDKQHGNNAMVNQIAFVDTGNALGNDALDTKVHGVDCGVLTGRALTVVFASDDDTAASRFLHLLCPSGKGGIIAGIAILTHERNIRAHGAELCAGRGNIVGGKNICVNIRMVINRIGGNTSIL